MNISFLLLIFLKVLLWTSLWINMFDVGSNYMLLVFLKYLKTFWNTIWLLSMKGHTDYYVFISKIIFVNREWSFLFQVWRNSVYWGQVKVYLRNLKIRIFFLNYFRTDMIDYWRKDTCAIIILWHMCLHRNNGFSLRWGTVVTKANINVATG